MRPASEYNIASHLPQNPKVNDAEVKKLIEQLDSDNFEKTRGQAQEKLASFGGQIAPLLEAERQNSSAEVRAIIRRLLAAIKENAPVSPELSREVRAVKVLEHIATPECRAAGGTGTGSRGRRADVRGETIVGTACQAFTSYCALNVKPTVSPGRPP